VFTQWQIQNIAHWLLGKNLAGGMRWAVNLKRDKVEVSKEIEQIVQKNALAPFNGIAGEKFVNVLEINLELTKRYGKPS
jgi:K+-transporting ATPase c subunit